MKKNIYQLGLWLITIGFIISGCSKEDDTDSPEPEPLTPVEKTLTTSASSVTLKAEGETQSVSIYSNTSWNISGEGTEQWCRIDKTTGTGNTNILLTAEKNPTDKERNFQYTITYAEGKKVNIHISQPGSDLRIAMSFNSQDETFSAGQSIGLFMVNRSAESTSTTSLHSFTGNQINNVKVTKQTDQTWKPSEDIYWQNQETTTDAYAYYPWRQSTSKDTPLTWNISVNEDQSSQANSSASIHLYGQKLAQSPGTNGVLDMAFTLLVAQVVFHIQIADDAKPIYELTDIYMTGTQNEATFDLNTGIITPSGSNSKVKGYMVTNTNDGYDVKFIIIPQSTQNISGTISYLDKRYNEIVTGDFLLDNNPTFIAGKSYSVNITQQKTFDKIKVENISISDWEKGDEFNFSFN